MRNGRKRRMRDVVRKAGLLLLLLSICLVQGCGGGQGQTEQAAAGETPEQEEQDGSGQKENIQTDDETGQEEGTQPQQGSEEPAAPGDGLASPSVTGALHVEGTQLTGENGQAVQLRGISTHGLAWFPDYVNADCFAELKRDWKANVVRLAMYTAEYGGYCAGGDQEALKQLIRDGVRYAVEADLYVIIDWHVLSEADPNVYKEEAKAFFAEMSAEYAGTPNVIYEICNEPNGGTAWSQVKSYALEVIGVIRQNDPDGVILVGTPNWCQFVDEAAADPITEYDNLMYTLHFYAATHKEDLRGRMEGAAKAGLPLFVSEYGICDASGNGAIDEGQADQWIALLDEYGISYVCWNLSNKDESSALLQSSCTKVSGFGEEDRSQAGNWLYRTLHSAADKDGQ